MLYYGTSCIPSTANVMYNSTNLNKVYYNNTLVWQKCATGYILTTDCNGFTTSQLATHPSTPFINGCRYDTCGRDCTDINKYRESQYLYCLSTQVCANPFIELQVEPLDGQPDNYSEGNYAFHFYYRAANKPNPDCPLVKGGLPASFLSYTYLGLCCADFPVTITRCQMPANQFLLGLTLYLDTQDDDDSETRAAELHCFKMVNATSCNLIPFNLGTVSLTGEGLSRTSPTDYATTGWELCYTPSDGEEMFTICHCFCCRITHYSCVGFWAYPAICYLREFDVKGMPAVPMASNVCNAVIVCTDTGLSCTKIFNPTEWYDLESCFDTASQQNLKWINMSLT